MLCGGIAIVFFHAVYLMASDWATHLQRMHEQVFNAWWVGKMAWVIPISYALIGATIAYRPSRRTGLWIAKAYVVALCMYLTLGKLKIIAICSCIGFISGGGYWENMRFNAKLLSVILLAIALERRWLVNIGINALNQLRKWRKGGAIRRSND